MNGNTNYQCNLTKRTKEQNALKYRCLLVSDLSNLKIMEVAETACYLGASLSALMAHRIYRMHDKTFINKMFLFYFAVDAIMGTLNTFLLFRVQRFVRIYINNQKIKNLVYLIFKSDRNEGEEFQQTKCSLLLSVWGLWEPSRQLILTGMMVMR